MRAARRARTPGAAAAESSLTQVVPATIAVATLTPLTNRPAHSATGLALPRARTTLPRTPSARAATTSGLRPTRSEDGPVSRNPGTSPRT